MRVAIAGSRSMLAQALARRCVAAGWPVTLVGRGPKANIAFDLSAPGPVELSGHDALVICASTFAGEGIEGLRTNLQANVLGALALAEAAIDAGVGRLVFVSSISALEARDSYGLSKATAEAVLRQVCPPRGVALTIVRPAQIYDTHGAAAAHQPFLYHLIDRIAAGADVSLFGSVDVERNYVHVDDVAQALAACLSNGVAGVFNAVHPESLKVSEAAETIRRVFGADSRIAFEPARPDMARISIPAADNLFSHLGLTPRAFSDGMSEVRAARRGQ